MVQEIKIKNFLSFRDETTLSFIASNDKFAEGSQVVVVGGSTRLLRLGIIYGYNASGKTNLLVAIDFLTSFITRMPESSDDGTNVACFRLDNDSVNQPTCFDIVFWQEDIKYRYQLKLTAQHVEFEKLSYYKSNQPIMLFERTFNNGQSEIVFNNQNGDKVSSTAKEKITVECLKNMSVFVAIGKVNVNLPFIDTAKNNLREQIMGLVQPQTDLTRYAQVLTAKENNITEHLIEFLKQADFNITGLSTKLINKNLPDNFINILLADDQLPTNERQRLQNDRSYKSPQTIFLHTVQNEAGEQTYSLALSDESLGTIKTFGIETAIYQAINKSALLTIDEIENSLHPKLLELMLFKFLESESRSQLLLSTHNDGFFDLIGDLFRRDSFWFVEKDRSGNSNLYKLTDFRGVNRLSSVREAYRNKRFGATLGHEK